MKSYVLLVAAFRSEEVDAEHVLRQLDTSARLKLSHFTEDEVRQLAESMAGRLPEEAIELIIQLGGGSPFMSSAVLHGLVESEVLVHEETHWRLNPLQLGAIHSSDREAEFLTRRLELLSDHVLKTLTAGAVIGKEFDFEMAGFLAEQEASDVFSAVDVARQRQLIWCRPDGVTCVFVHDKIRQALLARLEKIRFCELHLRAAHYFQQQDSSFATELAYHFDAAEASDLAFPYALEAAEEARSRHALETAEKQYQIARRGARIKDRNMQYRVAEGFGAVLMLRGKYDLAEEVFEEAAHLATSEEAKAQIRGKLAELSFKRGDMERAVQDYEQALRSLGRRIPTNQVILLLWLFWEVVVQVFHTFLPKLFLHRYRQAPTESERLTIRLFSGLAHGCWYCRGCINTLWAHLRGLNLAERYQPTSELGNAYSEHAPVMSLLGLFSRGISYAEKSLRIRRELGELWGQGQSLHYYGVVLYAASRYSECINRCRESIRLLERMGDYWQVHIARYQIAASYYRLGDLPLAVEESKKNHQSGLDLGDELASGIILDIWARAAKDNLPPELMSTELHRKRTDAQGQAQVLFANGLCQLRQGELQTASEQLAEAVQIVYQAGICNSYTLPFRAWLATCYRMQAEAILDYTPHRRRALIQQAAWAAVCARLASWRCQNDLPHIYREQALILSLKGSKTKARKRFLKSLRHAKQQQSRYEFAQTMMAYAKVGSEFGWTVPPAELEEAKSILAELQMASDFCETSPAIEEAAPSLSLADRFEMVLESGRKIATGLSEQVIYQETFAAACRLLRVHHGVILKVNSEAPVAQWKPVAGQMGWGENSPLIQEALTAGRAMARQRETKNSDANTSGTEGSEICVPLYLRGTAVACISMMHPDIQGLFGEDEERLADFLATIAGAALENAEGFSELQKLNATLERRVQDRTAVVEARSRELTQSNQDLERTANELRRAQTQLSASKQAAEAASEAKSRFLATMSHEIRTPMNGILGMAELVLGSSLTDRQRGYLDTLKGSANALLTLLNDLLDFSKIEAGKMELESIPFSLRDVVLDSARLLAVPVSKKGLNLICRIEPDVPTEVIGDPNRLRQILVNLLGNAMKFTLEGEVAVRVSIASHAARGLRLRFSVSDTGIGIPKNKQQSIFEAFHQTDSSVTRRFGGTGLGLAISSQLVGLMDGAIQLESEEGQGTVFHVDLPFEFAENSTPQAGLHPVLEERGLRVLSDHPESQTAVCDLLGYLGLPYVREEDLSPLSTSEPHPLLVADFGVDSQAMLDVLTSRIFEGSYQPEEIVCLIPAGQTELLAECEALAIDQILTKPVKPQELTLAIQKSLEYFSPGQTEVETTTEEAGSGKSSLRILVADDSPVNREVATGMLELCGHQVASVSDGSEAVEAVQSEEFDLVFMDLEMPLMDGLAATRAIRLLPNHKSRIPIYAMTAHALTETDGKCQAAGMDGFITKPIVPAQLMELLDRVCALG